jgi:DNA-binding MarR family transcriptional regulator
MDGHEQIDFLGVTHEAGFAGNGGASLDYGILGRVVGFPLKLAWVNIYNLLATEFGDTSITPQRVSMLELISCNPGRSQSDLAKALGLSRPATSLIIDFWQRRDCVERRPSPHDRRSFGIFLTGKGEKTARELREGVKRAEAEFASRLSDAEIVQLKSLLAKLRS